MPKETRRLLTILLVIFFLIGIVLTLLAVLKGFNPFFKAELNLEPKELVLSNLTSSSATISFFTEEPNASVVVKYGENSGILDQVEFDSRGQDFKSSLHSVRLTSLRPANFYYYKITVNGTEFQNSGSPYSLQTLPVASTPALPDNMTGTLEPAVKNCLVFAHLVQSGATSYPLSAITDTQGGFVIDKNGFYSKSSKDLITGTDSDQILVYAHCPDNSRFGTVVPYSSAAVQLTASSKITINYNNDQQSFSAADTTSTPAATSIPAVTASATPAAAVTTVASPTPRPTSTPRPVQPSSTPVPAAQPADDNLPATGIEDYYNIFLGLILISAGYILQKRISLSRRHTE